MNAQDTPKVPLLDLDLLKTLVAIADTGTFSAAADVVFRTPSAVSMQVKKIEEIVGRPVFVRDSRNVALTPDGSALVEHGRRLLALNRDMISRFITPDVSGVVRLGVPDDVAERMLPPMLARFCESHPGVTVNAHIAGSNEMIGMVRSGDLDMAIITRIERHRLELDFETLFEEQLVWATRKCGIAAEQSPVPISVWDEGCAWRTAALEGLQEIGRDYRITFQSAHIAAQRAAVMADLAVAPFPRSALTEEIVEAKAGHGLPPLPSYLLGLLVPADASPAVKAAADHLRASFAQAAP